MKSYRRFSLVASLAVATATACESAAPTGPAPYKGPPIPWAYEAFPATPAPKDNPVTDAKVQLGTLLFYDPILSSDQKVACATCHSEQWGMADGLPLSVGIDGTGPTGPGRTGPNMTTRNAMTLWNAAFRKELFWDGRSPSLEDQALRPLEQPKEMNLPPDEAAARVAAVPEYVTMFANAFPGETVTPTTIAKALASFERRLVTSRAPYDHYVGGDPGAMSASELHGMQLFGKSGCAGCHAPPLFEADRYVKRRETTDDGRYAVTNNEADRGAFRIPTLRNIRETGPYFHDGSVADLDAAVRAELEVDVAAGKAEDLSDADVSDLSAFIANALMERLNNPIRPYTVPSGLQVPSDGFRIQR